MIAILMLEDEASVAGLLRHMLKEYAVIGATSAEQAIREFHERVPAIELLIADVTLPVSSGIPVALRLRHTEPGLPVILTSGYPMNAWSERALADLARLGLSSVRFLQKPFRSRDVQEAVRELVRGSKTGRSTTA